MSGLALGVKVCGLTHPDDAALAVALGARAIGLNFFPGSPRCVPPARAAEIAARVRGRALVVGVFVNQPAAEIAAIDAQVGLDRVQLHGDESAAEGERWGGRLLRAVRFGGEPAGAVELATLAAQRGAAAFLFDVYRAGTYGGTGESWDWSTLARLPLPRPYYVAGGLRPGNARQALLASGADGVDVCSGVEASPGRKDPRRLEQLLSEVLDVG